MAELTVENLHLRLGGNEILKGVGMSLDRGRRIVCGCFKIKAPLP
ncbi:hypothetical protein [Azospirillum rugosum]|uniref:ABC-type histidine transport system ATPase subunit n=1 Tax=Azospirillum rugosum TaxID=416170 RepID=A0ABS4SML5_9PROT|nr:hypothetical protein [Azospirillum rugosum]MBP2293807.1 ABC-type histidine transport system ATPase subunit [Azospirillum rugosum]MDQ0527352.1 ABC-type histidine transport system ATPase subunit [Azospirillum rugosum]